MRATSCTSVPRAEAAPAWHDRAVISRKLLNEGEDVVLATRTHVKVLLLPAVVLIVVAGLAGYLSTLPSGDNSGTWQLVIWVVAALLVLWWVVVPFLRWLLTTYVFTNRRLITRTGILTRRGHDIPLVRISDASYEKGVVDRMLGCGTLIVAGASEQGPLRLRDIPHVEQVQLVLSDQLFHGADRTSPRADDGT